MIYQLEFLHKKIDHCPQQGISVDNVHMSHSQFPTQTPPSSEPYSKTQHHQELQDYMTSHICTTS